MLTRILLASAAIFISSATAHSDLVNYTNENTYQNAIGNFDFESFESLSTTGLSNAPITTSLFSVVPLAGQLAVRDIPDEGRFATDGMNYLEASFPDRSVILRFDLVNEANTFGFSITDFGDQTPGSFIIVTDTGAGNFGINVASHPLSDGNELFFGFSQDTPFTSLLVFQTSQNDGFGIDGVYLSTIPEPGSMGILLGLSCCLLSIRKRKQS